MGKHRKARQVADQTLVEPKGDAPLEFLTSDDFQVVPKKGHQPKNDHQPRTTCHSGFWGASSTVDTTDNGCDDCPRNGASSGDTADNGPGTDNDCQTCNDCDRNGLLEVCDGVQRLCMNGGGDSKLEGLSQNILLEESDGVNANARDRALPESEDASKRLVPKKGQQPKNDPQSKTTFHSGFWGASSTGDSADNGPGTYNDCKACNDCDRNRLPEVCNRVQRLCMNGGGDAYPEVLSQNVLPEESADGNANARDTCHLGFLGASHRDTADNGPGAYNDCYRNGLPEVCESLQRLCMNGRGDPDPEVLSQNVLPEESGDVKAGDRASPESEDASKLSELGCRAEKARKKKAREKQKVGGNSSSSDFSEVQAASSEEKEKRKRPSKRQLAAIHDALLRAREEEELRRHEEEAQRKMDEEAEWQAQERQRLEQEKKDKKKLKEKQKRERLKSEGRLLSKSQKQSRARLAATLEAFRQQGIDVPQPRGAPIERRRLDSSQSDSGIERHKSESLSSQESGKESLSDLPGCFDSKEESDPGHFSCSEESEEEHRPREELRSPVICVLGHVDAGKTKLLDYIRKTHVQDCEAGGITQQIGATMIPRESLREKCRMVRDFTSHPLRVPGLLVIDTPGHEAFRNLRSRGVSICDMAILVVDIMHGLQPQTLESIELLKRSKIPFVVALNKVDRIYGWKGDRDTDIVEVIDRQNSSTRQELKKLTQDLVLQFANQCLNAALFHENSDPRTFVSMVPTSAVSGDGMGNLLASVTQLTQSFMRKRLTFSEELQATVLEVKAIPGLGTTIDVILVNGRLREGDQIVLAGHEGPLVTHIRSLLMPRPLREMRVKNPYIEYKSVEGAQGVKVTGRELDKAIAGTPLFVALGPGDTERLRTELLSQCIHSIRTSERGVYILASTLGSLEALLDHLAGASIPYFGVKVGPVVKRDVMKASIMLEHDKLYATILAFDVKVDRDAQELADSLGVRIFSANIIYHLFDMFVKYREEFDKKRDEARHQAVFPCILKVLPTSDEAVLNVLVEAGTLRQYTPLCVSTQSNLELGIVSAIKVDGEYVACAKEGQQACITVEGTRTRFGEEDYLISRVTRQSIEVCKEHYRDELGETDWHLMSELKKMLHLHA